MIAALRRYRRHRKFQVEIQIARRSLRNVLEYVSETHDGRRLLAVSTSRQAHFFGCAEDIQAVLWKLRALSDRRYP